MTEIVFKLKIEGPDNFSQDFEIPMGISTIGRQPGNDLVLPHTLISRGHARIEAIANECHITDLGSSNGTAVNGTKIPPNAPTFLKSGDQIKIGPFYMSFEQTGSIPAETPALEPELSIPPEPIEEEPVPESKPAPAKKPRPKKTKKAAKETARTPPPAAPPPSSPPPATVASPPPTNGQGHIPPGMTLHSQKLIGYLPGIYHTDFMGRFLGIFESIQTPVEWTIDNFDIFLDPDSSPDGFLPWLASWFGIIFDSTWSIEKRRLFLKEAHTIYARRGTRWSLSKVLEIYTGAAPDIDDTNEKLDPFTFTVTLPFRKRDVDSGLVEALIDQHKPAHTNYTLKYKG